MAKNGGDRPILRLMSWSKTEHCASRARLYKQVSGCGIGKCKVLQFLGQRVSFLLTADEADKAEVLFQPRADRTGRGAPEPCRPIVWMTPSSVAGSSSSCYFRRVRGEGTVGRNPTAAALTSQFPVASVACMFSRMTMLASSTGKQSNSVLDLPWTPSLACTLRTNWRAWVRLSFASSANVSSA